MAIATVLSSGVSRAQETESLEEVVVVAPYGLTLARDRVPASTRKADAEEIELLQPLDLSDLLNRGFGSVSINHAQNNPLQPDVSFRGFTASPLLGLPQGLSVYANGVRMNETFGDTVNWDLLPVSAIDNVQLLAGPNPVFGLNTLGGALSLQLKSGFTHIGTGAEISGGSFGRLGSTLQYGDNNGAWGWYGNVDYFEEDGWRDYSPSDALRFYGVLSHRDEQSSFDLSVAHAHSDLRGNGSSPVELLEIDRAQVFTHPDTAENTLTQVILEGSHQLSGQLVLAGNTFYRELVTNTFNGDGTIFEECEFGADEFLVEEAFDDENGDGECNAADDANITLVSDEAGNPIEAEVDGEELNAVNNIGRRKQRSYGTSLQLAHDVDLDAGRRNAVAVGASFTTGDATFDSVVEVAQLLESRSTSRTGIYADDFRTNVDSEVTTWSLYATNMLDVTRRVSLTLSGRYDATRITLADRSGQSPELNGRHSFGQFNPAAGLAFRLNPDVMLYGNLSQSSRTPTAVELACADEDAPCSLPNAFLADPPLDEVVARSAELGARGRLGSGIDWQAGVFDTLNRNDILFQTLGGPQANVGFFANVADTRRAGIELSLSQRVGSVHWTVDYSLIDATFEEDFIVNSPNHPEPPGELVVGDDKLLVASGSTIPNIPRHQMNLGLDFGFNDRLTLGTDLQFRSGVYLRGDEVNALGKTSSYTVLNLRGEWRVTDAVKMIARIENLLDEDYETFGILGEPNEVFEDFEDPRFYGAGPPRGAWLGLRMKFD